MDRLFLDANVLFSAAYVADARLRELWMLQDVDYGARVMHWRRRESTCLTRCNGRGFLSCRNWCIFVEAGERRLPARIALPEKDAPILLAVIEAGANYLLTGDVHHFGQYFGKRVEGVTILPPARYLKIKNRKARH